MSPRSLYTWLTPGPKTRSGHTGSNTIIEESLPCSSSSANDSSNADTTSTCSRPTATVPSQTQSKTTAQSASKRKQKRKSNNKTDKSGCTEKCVLKKKRTVCNKWKQDFGWVEVRNGLVFCTTCEYAARSKNQLGRRIKKNAFVAGARNLQR